MQLYWNHTLAWVFSCKFAATPFPKNTSGGQLLKETTADLQELWMQKSFFSCVYATMGATCLDIFFYSIWQVEDIIFYTRLWLFWDLYQPPCYCVFWNKCFEKSPPFQSVIFTITLQCCYQRDKIKNYRKSYLSTFLD